MYDLSQYAIGERIPWTEMSPSYETRDIQSVGLIFPPAATVGSPVMAVCDTVPGRINPVEGIVIY